MIDKVDKSQRNTEVGQSPPFHIKLLNAWKSNQVNLKLRLHPIGILCFLGLWISLCINNDGFLLNQALICSSIISALLFFRAAEQNGDWSNSK